MAQDKSRVIVKYLLIADPHTCNGKDRPATPGSQNIYCQIDLVAERIRHLAHHVVAYHFCQSDNNNTCLIPDFVHSIAAQLCQAPQLSAYKEYLLSEPHVQVREQKERQTFRHCMRVKLHLLNVHILFVGFCFAQGMHHQSGFSTQSRHSGTSQYSSEDG